MDPFEEFEFKPLTDGLGFHKSKNPGSSPTPDKKLESKTESRIPAMPPLHSEKSETSKNSFSHNQIEEVSPDPLRPPLPRKNRGPALPPTPPATVKEEGTGTVDEILKTLQKNRRFDFENSKPKTAVAPVAPAKEEYRPTVWSISAASLDTMLVLAASLLCMIILLVVTKVDLIGNLKNPDQMGMIYLSTLALFATVVFIYLTLNRIYVGYTPGEWAFDQRVGQPEDMNTAMYSLKVVGRSLLIVLTGFFVLPLLSVLIGKDLAGLASGAQLYKKV